MLYPCGIQRNMSWVPSLGTIPMEYVPYLFWDLPGGSDSKESAYNAEDTGSSPGSGKSPGQGNGNPLQYSCLGSPRYRGAWKATIRGVTKSWT